jgi:hypothetical protein
MRFIAHIPDMSESTAGRSIFSLRTSAFNDFLYAPVGEEDNGMVLTMLSALARCEVDPWGEAARLSELPREAATKRLALMISSLPRGQWPKSAVSDIASRLTALLPGQHSSDSPVQPTASANVPPKPATKMTFLFISLIVILLSAQALTVYHGRAPPPPIEQSQRADAPQTSQQVPLAK